VGEVTVVLERPDESAERKLVSERDVTTVEGRRIGATTGALAESLVGIHRQRTARAAAGLRRQVALAGGAKV
jgi:hypothetical protein